MRKIISAVLVSALSLGAFPLGVAHAEETKKYLFYEDFDHMTDGELPNGFKFELGGAELIEKTVVDEANGDYAMKLTSGSEMYALGMELGEVVTGVGDPNNPDTKDLITIEFDLKNEYGGWALSWLTAEEKETGIAKIINKMILNLGFADRKLNPATGTSQTWGGPFEPAPWNAGGMLEGDTEFSSFGRWIHVKMTLDGERIDNSYQWRFMKATLEWTDGDNTYSLYHKGDGGHGMYIEGQNAKYDEVLGGMRQRDVASVVIPVAGANGSYIPTMEIDNLEIYIKGEASTTPKINGVTFDNAGTGESTPRVILNFSEAMRSNVLKNITLSCDGENVPIAPVISADGKSCIIKNALTKAGEYRISVAPGGISYTGGIMKNEYSHDFSCVADNEGNVNLLPMALGLTAKLWDGSETDKMSEISPFLKEIRVKFSSKMSNNIGDYVTVSDGLIYTDGYSDDKTEYIIYPQNMEAGKSYMVTVPAGTPAEWGGATDKAVNFNIKTSDEKDVVYTPIEIEKASAGADIQKGEACKAAVEIFKTSTEAEKATLIVCQYQYVYGFEKLKSVEFKHISLEGNVQRKTAEVEFTPADYVTRIKTYILSYPNNEVIGKLVSEVK